jgi:hypothetical protein
MTVVISLTASITVEQTAVTSPMGSITVEQTADINLMVSIIVMATVCVLLNHHLQNDAWAGRIGCCRLSL